MQKALETQRKRARGLRTALRVAQRAGTVLAERQLAELRDAAAAQTSAALAAAAAAEARAAASEARLLQLETNREAHALLVDRPPSWFLPLSPTEDREFVPLFCPLLPREQRNSSQGDQDGHHSHGGTALGIGMATVGSDAERALFVAEVRSGGQAERGGLRLGDHLVAVSAPRPQEQQSAAATCGDGAWSWGWQWREGSMAVPDADSFAAMIWSLRQSGADGAVNGGVVLWAARPRSHSARNHAAAPLPAPLPSPGTASTASSMTAAATTARPSARRVPDSPRCSQGSHRRRLRAATQLECAAQNIDEAERALRMAAMRSSSLVAPSSSL